MPPCSVFLGLNKEERMAHNVIVKLALMADFIVRYFLMPSCVLRMHVIQRSTTGGTGGTRRWR